MISLQWRFLQVVRCAKARSHCRFHNYEQQFQIQVFIKRVHDFVNLLLFHQHSPNAFVAQLRLIKNEVMRGGIPVNICTHFHDARESGRDRFRLMSPVNNDKHTRRWFRVSILWVEWTLFSHYSGCFPCESNEETRIRSWSSSELAWSGLSGIDWVGNQIIFDVTKPIKSEIWQKN